MQPSPFTIALLQSACTPDPAHNLATTIAQIRQAASRGAQVICTQELFRTQYFCQSEDPANFDLAEPIPGPTTTTLAALAQELHVALVASLFERRAPGLYHNTAAVIDADGTLLGTYRKMHIPDDPLYYEKYYFTPGDAPAVVPTPSSAVPQSPPSHSSTSPFRTFQTKYGRIGVLICWDQWFPEAARLTALQDCSVLFYPTAIAWHPREQTTLGPAQLDAWLTIQRAHAIANGIYVAAANRIGLETLPTPPHPLSPQPSVLPPPTASTSSAPPSSPTPSAKSSKKPPPTKKKSSSPPSTPPSKNKPAKTGPSSATAASTPMPD